MVETMQVARRSVEIITSSRLVAFTDTARVECDNAVAGHTAEAQPSATELQLSGPPELAAPERRSRP